MNQTIVQQEAVKCRKAFERRAYMWTWIADAAEEAKMIFGQVADGSVTPKDAYIRCKEIQEYWLDKSEQRSQLSPLAYQTILDIWRDAIEMAKALEEDDIRRGG